MAVEGVIFSVDQYLPFASMASTLLDTHWVVIVSLAWACFIWSVTRVSPLILFPPLPPHGWQHNDVHYETYISRVCVVGRLRILQRCYHLVLLTMISLSLCLTNNGSDVIIISDDWKGMLHRLRGMDVPRILHVLRFVLELVHAYTKIQWNCLEKLKI